MAAGITGKMKLIKNIWRKINAFEWGLRQL